MSIILYKSYFRIIKIIIINTFVNNNIYFINKIYLILYKSTNNLNTDGT